MHVSIAVQKHDALRRRLESLGSLLVAYSGGVDSTFLAFTARACLGERSLAVLGVSATVSAIELDNARATAEVLGLRFHQVETHELADPRFQANPHDRCYYCKSELFSVLGQTASAYGMEWIADGTNADDLGEHRPGRRAATDNGVLSPLLDAGLSKEEIRRLSRDLGLPTWDKPAMACLSSRFPYGSPITPPMLGKVAAAEAACRSLGLRQVRVRAHGDVARVEVESSEMERAFALRRELALGVKAAGFRFVAQDLEGYRSGSFDRTANRSRSQMS